MTKCNSDTHKAKTKISGQARTGRKSDDFQYIGTLFSTILISFKNNRSLPLDPAEELWPLSKGARIVSVAPWAMTK